MQKLVEGLDVLYQKQIIHRDLNVNNIMLHIPELEPTENDFENIDEYLWDKLECEREAKLRDLLTTEFQVKIIDYGISRTIGQGSVAETPCGVRELAAPELINGNGYDFRVDVWNVAVIAYMLLTMAVPFQTGLERDIGVW